MRKTRVHAAVAFCVLLSGCASQMKIKGTTLNGLQPLRKTESVVIIEENEAIEPDKKNIKIGRFEIKDGGLSIDCDYKRVKSIAKNKARNLGGNTVKIVEHKLPNYWSKCHRITFEVYKLENTANYEKDLVWSASNKLKWEHFRGAPKVDKSSHFCGYIDVQFNDMNFFNGEGEVNISPIFLFECSYVQPLKKDKYLLEYNQVKFDLLEFYSRKMRKEFQKSEINTKEKWLKFAEAIYNKVYTEYNTDLFNLETETNFGETYSGVIGWTYKTQNDLKTLTEFSSEAY